MALADLVSTSVVSTALLCLFGGYAFGASAANKRAQKLFGWRTDESERIRLETETRYLEVLRRELANVIVTDDPKKMVAIYFKAWDFEREVSRAASSRVEAELTEHPPDKKA